MFRILKLLWPYRKRVAFGIFSLLIVDAAQLVIPLIIRKVIDQLVILRVSEWPKLSFYATIIALLAVVIALLRFVWRYFLIGAARKVEKDMRDRLFRHFLELDHYFYKRRSTGDLMAHVTNDIDAVRMATSMGVIGTFDALIYTTFAIGAMLYISPKLTLYALIPLPMIAFVSMGFGKLIHKFFRAVQASFSSLTEGVRETIAGIRVIKGFNALKGQIDYVKRLSLDYVQKNLQLVKVWGLFWPLISFLGGLASVIVLYFGGIKVISNEISLGDFVAFASYLAMMVWPMIAIGWVVNVFQRGSASLERIEKLLSERPKIVSGKVKKEIEGHIAFKKLYFAYDTKPVLKNISFEINPGQKVGIVGIVGSGKSTLLKFLPRIIDPPKGSVFLDGIEIRDYELKSLRDQISYVPQETILFSTTIRENLLLGIPEERKVSDEELIKILKAVEIWDEIEEFPDGLDTLVGERGITLSGGQRQRIAIARALLKNSKLLLIDDALSAVDTRTEQKIIANLTEYLREKTTLIVTHRLSVIQDADFIIVLDRGRIIESGTHEELIKREGLYAKLYEIQKLAGEKDDVERALRRNP